MITIDLKDFGFNEEDWLAKNVGPRMHYLHTSIGGQGWIAKRADRKIESETSDGEKYTLYESYWKLTLEDERYATWFKIMFPG